VEARRLEAIRMGVQQLRELKKKAEEERRAE
jgi:hypothetical protein